MVKYNEVKEKFKEHGCQLLMTEEEFNQKKRIINEKYKYTAKCGHNHEVWFYNVNRLIPTSLFCPKCSNMNHSKNQKEKYRLNPVSTNELEYMNIIYLKTRIDDSFDVKFNNEGCLADCCINVYSPV